MVIVLEEPNLSRYQEFLLINIEFCLLDVANRQDIFDQKNCLKTFCKLRDLGFSELNICSKINMFLKTDRVNNEGQEEHFLMNNRVIRCLLPPSIMWLLEVRDENEICLFTPRYGMFSTNQAIL